MIKALIKHFIASFYIQFGFVRRAKKKISTNRNILSIYFHNPSLQTFNDCLLWLVNNDFEFIDANELLVLEESQLLNGKNKVIITIDDGWKENLLNIIPIAHFNKIPITIFVTTAPLIDGGGYWWSYIKAGLKRGVTTCTIPFLKTLSNDNRLSIVNYVKSLIYLDREAMTVEELKSIASSPYVQIGAHTVTHPILTTCSDEVAAQEIQESKFILEAIIPMPITQFSYPNGNFSDREVAILKKQGYQMAFTTKPAMIKLGKSLDLYRLPRLEVLDEATLNENICRMTGVWF